ncbi:unnamed protein product [Amoebophrya sp. A120]|nr:unnamed protein product [Amoebophrya sp. A120]|eukprot:GSA120T00015682001.1
MASSSTSFEQKYSKLDRNPLGEGTYGEVFRVRNTVTGETVAMKRMKLQDEEEGVPSTAIREVAILKELDHPNVVKLLDVCCTQNKLLLIFEFVDSDLKKYMRKNGSGPLPSETARSFVQQMLKGICFCHERRIIHRDLKPQNLLVTHNNQLKLADFGLARTYSVPMPKYTHEVVTVWYRSPEILLGQELYALPVDLWSVGCIFAEMGCGQPLFAGDSEIDTIFKIFQKLGTPSEEEWATMYELPNMKSTFPKWKKKPWPQIRDLGTTLGMQACDLIEDIMKYDPMQRLSAKQCLRHPYFNSIPFA